MSDKKRIVKFYTALGTPEDNNRILLEDSLAKEIEDQIENGCSGLFVLGSMGYGLQVRDSNVIPSFRTAIDVSRGRVPVLVKVTDLSIGRVLDRINDIITAKLEPDGVFLYTPFLEKLSTESIVNLFVQISQASPFPVYIYDLPSVCRNKITEDIMNLILEKTDNILGIKTADLDLGRSLLNAQKEGKVPSDFRVICSNLDRFHESIVADMPYQLDGMFACTAPLTNKMYAAYNSSDAERGKFYLDKIIDLRNLFLKGDVLPLFTVAMNALGYAGNFHPDLDFCATVEQKKLILNWLQKEKLIE